MGEGNEKRVFLRPGDKLIGLTGPPDRQREAEVVVTNPPLARVPAFGPALKLGDRVRTILDNIELTPETMRLDADDVKRRTTEPPPCFILKLGEQLRPPGWPRYRHLTVAKNPEKPVKIGDRILVLEENVRRLWLIEAGTEWKTANGCHWYSLI